jgi:hypothetical protein
MPAAARSAQTLGLAFMVESPERRKLLLALADQELQGSLRPLGFTRRNKKSPFVATLGANSEVLVFPQIHSRNTFPRLNPVVAVENQSPAQGAWQLLSSGFVPTLR